ncbi:MAG TPA: hypothetical protein VLT62_25360 [Candidatus Methylomirabilis sp.]|nr:hypothetical protein [Candidatus Methylomirabilis sp.]
MQLPNGERAVVDLRKLRDYCLNPDSPRGRHKARVFAAALGLTAEDAPKLQAKLREIARTGNATLGEVDLYGQRYTIDCEMVTEVGKAMIRSCWIVPRGKTTPRLTTCYIKKRRR